MLYVFNKEYVIYTYLIYAVIGVSERARVKHCEIKQFYSFTFLLDEGRVLTIST